LTDLFVIYLAKTQSEEAYIYLHYVVYSCIITILKYFFGKNCTIYYYWGKTKCFHDGCLRL